MSKSIGVGDSFAVIGGIYSNLEALLAFRSKMMESQIPADRIFCTGDTVAYASNPNEVVSVIRNWGIRCIAGNVEIQLAEEGDHCGCNFTTDSVCDVLSQKWYTWLKSNLDPSHKEWMKSLPKMLRLSLGKYRAILVHGAFTGVSKYIFESSHRSQFEAEFQAADAEIIFAGHCGLPFLKKLSNKIWANSGALGMPPNDGTSRTWYLTANFQEKGLEFELAPLIYAFESASKAMRSTKLPLEYSQTLLTGIWPSPDILSESERVLQGIPRKVQKISLC